jgi:magnesium transporter
MRDGALVEATDTRGEALPEAAWLDLVSPTTEERSLLGDTFGRVLTHDVDPGEIEATSRFREDATSLMLQLNFLDHTGERLRNMNVAIAWRDGRLVSIHDRELVAAAMFRVRAADQPGLVRDGMTALLGLMESKIDHLADVLEDTFARLEDLSRQVLDDGDVALKDHLVALADVEERNGRIRLNLMDTQRVLNSLVRSAKVGSGKARLIEVLRDIDSLLSHTAFLLEEISFLSDTVLGLINTEQSQIVKVLSVVGVLFLPPTLIASLYGMNFRRMPELDWTLGYPLALMVMALVGVAPYLYAKRRGWL